MAEDSKINAGLSESRGKKALNAAKKVMSVTLKVGKKSYNVAKSVYKTLKNKKNKNLAVKLASGELGTLTPEQVAFVYDVLKDIEQTRKPHAKEVNALSNIKAFADKYLDSISADKSILTAGNAKQAAEWLKISQDVQDKINHNQVEAKTERNNNVALILEGYGIDTKSVTAAEKKEAASKAENAATPVVQQEDNIMLRQQREKEAELRNKDEKLYQQYMEGKAKEAVNEVSNVKENQTAKKEKEEEKKNSDEELKKAMYSSYDKDNGTHNTETIAETANKNSIKAALRGTRVEHSPEVKERMEHYTSWHNRESCMLSEYAAKNGMVAADNFYGSENYNPDAINKAYTDCLTGKNAEKYQEFRRERLKEKDMQNWPGLEKDKNEVKKEEPAKEMNTPTEKKEAEKTAPENVNVGKENTPSSSGQKEEQVLKQPQVKESSETKKPEPNKEEKTAPAPEKKKRKNPIDKTSKKYRDWKAAQLSGRIRPKKSRSKQNNGRARTMSNQTSLNLALQLKNNRANS